MGACLQLLARGSALNPADPALYQARGIVEKEGRRFDAARATFRQGLAVDPQHLYLWQVCLCCDACVCVTKRSCV